MLKAFSMEVLNRDAITAVLTKFWLQKNINMQYDLKAGRDIICKH